MAENRLVLKVGARYNLKSEENKSGFPAGFLVQDALPDDRHLRELATVRMTFTIIPNKRKSIAKELSHVSNLRASTFWRGKKLSKHPRLPIWTISRPHSRNVGSRDVVCS